jgi:hypothetical protein
MTAPPKSKRIPSAATMSVTSIPPVTGTSLDAEVGVGCTPAVVGVGVGVFVVLDVLMVNDVLEFWLAPVIGSLAVMDNV